MNLSDLNRGLGQMSLMDASRAFNVVPVGLGFDVVGEGQILPVGPDATFANHVADALNQAWADSRRRAFRDLRFLIGLHS